MTITTTVVAGMLTTLYHDTSGKTFTCARSIVICVAIVTSWSWMGLWRYCWCRHWLGRVHCTDREWCLCMEYPLRFGSYFVLFFCLFYVPYIMALITNHWQNGVMINIVSAFRLRYILFKVAKMCATVHWCKSHSACLNFIWWNARGYIQHGEYMMCYE